MPYQFQPPGELKAKGIILNLQDDVEKKGQPCRQYVVKP